MIGDKPFNDLRINARLDNYLDMLEQSGFMTKARKQTTFFMKLKKDDLPFPGIKINAMFPVNNYEEEIKIGEKPFMNNFSSYDKGEENQNSVVVAMYSLSGVFLLVSMILLIFYCIKVRKEVDESDPL